MATVRPFQGILYDPRRVDLSKVVAPPYDVITPQEQQRLYRQDPHNVVRLIAGEVWPTDSPEDNKYTRAAGFFSEWLEEGVLHREKGPRLYAYRQQFVDPTSGATRARVGIIGVVELEPFGAGVLPHERTHARAKADRLSLTRAVGANLSPVFALYDDPQSAVSRIIEPVITEPPGFSMTTAGKEHHRVWAIADPGRVRELTGVFTASRLYMADGHHRYETALNFRNRQRMEHPDAPRDAAFNYVLMLLVDVDDPGLAILPTHRVLRDLEGFDSADLLRRLGARHRVTVHADRAALLADMRDPTSDHRIGLALSGTLAVPFPVHGGGQAGGPSIYATVDVASAGAGDPVSQLDVSVLHREIFENELEISESMLEQERYLTYSRAVEPALTQVERAGAQAAFLLRPPAVADVVAVARAGQVMPQKSTYFFPKPLSGIVFNLLDANIRIPSV